MAKLSVLARAYDRETERRSAAVLDAAAARRIVIVLHDLGLGGTERIAIRLANHWAGSGRRVTLLCGTREGPLAPLIDADVEVVECDPPIVRSRGSRRRLGQATAAFVATRRVDVLFVPGNYHWPILPAVARLPDNRRPGVVAQISTPLYRPGRGPLRQLGYNIQTRRRLRDADAAISLSPQMTRDADRVLGRPITQCLRLPALDDEVAGGGAMTSASGRTILAAGRLVAEKGFEVALHAFARLDDPAARLVILGEGPDRAKLAALAAALGVADRVEMPGYVADIGPWLRKARVFLLSSYYEGYAAVVVEALAAGRPVVATDCTPAAYELLGRPGRGFVAPVGDAAALADCLRRVLETAPGDPLRLADAVAGYRIGPIARAYLDVFDRVHARRGALVPTSPHLWPVRL